MTTTMQQTTHDEAMSSLLEAIGLSQAQFAGGPQLDSAALVAAVEEFWAAAHAAGDAEAREQALPLMALPDAHAEQVEAFEATVRQIVHRSIRRGTGFCIECENYVYSDGGAHASDCFVADLERVLHATETTDTEASNGDR